MKLAEGSRRLFLALWPDSGQQNAMAYAARTTILASGGRRVASSSLHLTLVFLGSVPERSIPQVASVAQRIASAWPAATSPLQFTFEHLEHWRKPQVLCAVPEATPDAAAVLAESLRADLISAGFVPDLKRFRAHVTLARKVPRGTHVLGMPAVSWAFTEFALVESRTQADGALYSVLDSWLLSRPHFV